MPAKLCQLGTEQRPLGNTERENMFQEFVENGVINLENVQLISTRASVRHFLMANNEFHPEGSMVQFCVGNISEHVLENEHFLLVKANVNPKIYLFLKFVKHEKTYEKRR